MMVVWYKLDVRLDWKMKKKNVLLDDVSVSQGVPLMLCQFRIICRMLGMVG